MQRTPLSPVRIFGLFSGFIAVSAAIGVLSAGLLLPAAGAAGAAANAGIDLFNNAPIVLVDDTLSATSTMYARDGKTVLAHFSDENRKQVPLAQISPDMQHAIVAIEDARFYDHGGIDPQGIFRAAIHNLITKGQQGASTLTQQYIKNLKIEQGVQQNNAAAVADAAAQNMGRKIEEMREAIAMEKNRTKDQILEGYLNVVYFSPQVYGIESAAVHYFSTTAAKLTVPQAALLAGMMQDPNRYNPQKNPKTTLERRNLVFDAMLKEKMITQAEHDSFMTMDLGLKITPVTTGCMVAANNMAYFCDYVKALLTQDDRFASLGASSDERKRMLQNGGLSITTSIDPSIQKSAYNSLRKWVPVGNSEKLAAAATTIDVTSGQILAMVQNTRQGLPAETGKAGVTSLNYNVDQTYGGSIGFATGSTFKAFTLAQYLKEGNSLGDLVDATQLHRPYSDFSCNRAPVAGGVYNFHNSADGEGNGPKTVLAATIHSINSAFVDIESRIDLCGMIQTAKGMGMHLASKTDPYGTKKYSNQLPILPSLTLGPNPVAPLTMAGGYGTFANDGRFCTPMPVLKITDRTGKDLAVPGKSCKQAISADVAHGVTYALKRVFQGTGGSIDTSGLPPVAGKTGTADASTNTWFVGYSHKVATAVWVADPKIYDKYRYIAGGQRPLRDINIAGHYYGTLFGADLAGHAWAAIMRGATGNEGDWPNPPYDMTKGSSVTVPTVDGQSYAAAKSILEGKGFTVTKGGTVQGSQAAGTVEKTSPAGGSAAASGSMVTIYMSDGSQQQGPGQGQGPHPKPSKS